MQDWQGLQSAMGGRRTMRLPSSMSGLWHSLHSSLDGSVWSVCPVLVL